MRMIICSFCRTAKCLMFVQVLLAMTGAAAAAEKPLWEAGIGAAAISFPAYRGSDKVHNFVVPVPYFTYHGDFLKADRQGIRGSLFESDKLELNLSLSASPPTKSDDVSVRNGMSDLEPTAEFGPQLDYTFWRSDNRARFIKLRLPVRAAFTVERSPENIGWIFSPNINLDVTDISGFPGWNLGVLAGPIYATKKQHQYFYGVDTQYATASRPAYDAKGGYSGTQFLTSLSKRFDRTWAGAYLRYDSLRGTAFDDSPLLARRSFVSFGVAISWILGESSTRVEAED